MSETAASFAGDTLQEAGAREIELRRERARLPEEIARASRRVQNLRGAGRREGDPQLEEALATVRTLIDRERVLPGAILEAVRERLAAEAEGLREEEGAVTAANEGLQADAREAHEALAHSRREAERAADRLAANEIRRESIQREARRLEVFAERAAASRDDPKRCASVLEDLRVEGQLLPLNASVRRE